MKLATLRRPHLPQAVVAEAAGAVVAAGVSGAEAVVAVAAARAVNRIAIFSSAIASTVDAGVSSRATLITRLETRFSMHGRIRLRPVSRTFRNPAMRRIGSDCRQAGRFRSPISLAAIGRFGS